MKHRAKFHGPVQEPEWRTETVTLSYKVSECTECGKRIALESDEYSHLVGIERSWWKNRTLCHTCGAIDEERTRVEDVVQKLKGGRILELHTIPRYGVHSSVSTAKVLTVNDDVVTVDLGYVTILERRGGPDAGA